MTKLVVVKSHAYPDNQLGIVTPIAYENDDGTYVPVSKDEFPNSGIFIGADYERIDNSFKDGEPFLLIDWSESESNWEENPKLQKFRSYGNKSAHRDSNTFLPVIESDLPDISTGLVERNLPRGISLFIRNEGKIYGPFASSTVEDELYLSPVSGTTPLNLPTDYVAVFEEDDLRESGDLIETSFNHDQELYIGSLKKVSLQNFEKLDYISDAKLIRFYTQHGFGKKVPTPLNKSDARKLQNAIELYKKQANKFNKDDRLGRLEGVIVDFLDFEGYGKDFIENFLVDNKEGRAYLDNYFEKNNAILIEQKKEEIEAQTKIEIDKRQKEVKQAEDEIKLKKKELEELNNKVALQKKKSEEEIESIKNQTDKELHQIQLEKQEELTNKNYQLEKDIKLKSSELNAIVERLETANDLEKLKQQVVVEKTRLETGRTDLHEIKRAIEQQKHIIESPGLTDKLVETNALIAILNGRSNTQHEHQSEGIELKRASIKLTHDNRSDYVKHFVDYLNNDYGKEFDYDETLNLVVNIYQSFLTILSGPPGTGKTSTAVRLAKVMGLTDPEDEYKVANFLNIAVGRGWVAGRDILGFYNSLKGVYQASRTGLYQFLKGDTVSAKDNELKKLILLDEANLSSMEHYWSDFLAMCDPEGMKRLIDLGIPNPEKRYLKIGQNIHFIGTINNDATTEKLSPRLIDRAPIITLAHNDTDKVATQNFSTSIFDGAIPHSDLNYSFNITASEAELSHDEKELLNIIERDLSVPISKTIPITVSQRKWNSIRRYCHIVNDVGEMRSQPLDYAVAQHILPLIEGYGPSFRERLVRLEQTFDKFDLKKSKGLLKAVIDRGDTFAESYSFF